MDPIVAALARAAGLEKALAAFPDDVIVAAEQALNNVGVVKVPTDPAAEPWPPMRPGVGLLGQGVSGTGLSAVGRLGGGRLGGGPLEAGSSEIGA